MLIRFTVDLTFRGKETVGLSIEIFVFRSMFPIIQNVMIAVNLFHFTFLRRTVCWMLEDTPKKYTQ